MQLLLDDLDVGALDGQPKAAGVAEAEVRVEGKHAHIGATGELLLHPLRPQDGFGGVVELHARGPRVVVNVTPLCGTGAVEHLRHAFFVGVVPHRQVVGGAQREHQVGVLARRNGLGDIGLGFIGLIYVVLGVKDDFVTGHAALIVDVLEVAVGTVGQETKSGQRTGLGQRHEGPDFGGADALVDVVILGTFRKIQLEVTLAQIRAIRLFTQAPRRRSNWRLRGGNPGGGSLGGSGGFLLLCLGGKGGGGCHQHCGGGQDGHRNAGPMSMVCLHEIPLVCSSRWVRERRC